MRKDTVVAASSTSLAIVLAVALLGMVNWLGSRHYVRSDWTGSQIYSLSDKTTNILKDLKDPVRVIVFMTQAQPAVHRGQGAAEPLPGAPRPSSRWSTSTPTASRCAPSSSPRSSASRSPTPWSSWRRPQEVRDLGPARRVRLLRLPDGPGPQDEGVQGRGAVHLGDHGGGQPQDAEGLLHHRARRGRPGRAQRGRALPGQGGPQAGQPGRGEDEPPLGRRARGLRPAGGGRPAGGVRRPAS